MRRQERFDAYKNTLRASALAAGVGLVSLPVEIPHYGFWPLGAWDIAHLVIAVALGACLVRFGRRWSTAAYDAVFVILVLPYIVTIWLPQTLEITLGHHVFEPLLAHQFLLLALAVLSPQSYAVAFGLLGLFTVHAMALWTVVRPYATTAALAREPYFTLMFAAIAVGILWSRLRRRDFALRLARAEARAEGLARMTRLLSAVRDRANSPLQALEVGLTLLEERVPKERGALSALRGALCRLIALQHDVSTLRAPEPSDRSAPDLDDVVDDLVASHRPPRLRTCTASRRRG